MILEFYVWYELNFDFIIQCVYIEKKNIPILLENINILLIDGMIFRILKKF